MAAVVNRVARNPDGTHPEQRQRAEIIQRFAVFKDSRFINNDPGEKLAQAGAGVAGDADGAERGPGGSSEEDIDGDQPAEEAGQSANGGPKIIIARISVVIVRRPEHQGEAGGAQQADESGHHAAVAGKAVGACRR